MKTFFTYLPHSTYKIFTLEKEVQEFLQDYYDPFFRILSDGDKQKLISTHSHGPRESDIDDKDILTTIQSTLSEIPSTPIDLVLFRGDDFNSYTDNMRPFLAHTFLETVAKNFHTKTMYTVYVPSGSKILPTCGLDVPGAFPEQEVLLETAKLKKMGRYSFLYKSINQEKIGE